jgi:hypothetical protein
MRRRGFLAGAIICVPFAQAWAHAMPNSTLVVELLQGAVRLVARIPPSELGAVLERGRPADRYVGEHADIFGADGRTWTAEVGPVAASSAREHPGVVVELLFKPPVGAATKAATLRYDAVNHRVASHYVLVYRRIGEQLVPLGRLQSPATELKLS